MLLGSHGRLVGYWHQGRDERVHRSRQRDVPLEEPDDVQLALIQSHGDKVCGACPAGQVALGFGTLRRLADHGAGARAE